jgi:hypothetical protein
VVCDTPRCGKFSSGNQKTVMDTKRHDAGQNLGSETAPRRPVPTSDVGNVHASNLAEAPTCDELSIVHGQGTNVIIHSAANGLPGDAVPPCNAIQLRDRILKRATYDEFAVIDREGEDPIMEFISNSAPSFPVPTGNVTGVVSDVVPPCDQLSIVDDKGS